MSARGGMFVLLGIAGLFLLLSVAGLVWGVATSLIFDIDGLLLAMICLMVAGIFSLMLFLLAKEQGWLSRLTVFRRKVEGAPPGPARGVGNSAGGAGK